MSGKRWGVGLSPVLFAAMAGPAWAINLSQLCSGAGDCVVTANTTIDAASGPLTVGGNFTVNSGVVLAFTVPIEIRVNGNMVLSGTVGAPGNGGAGGAGGATGQPGGAGGSAPAVVSGVFNVQGSVTLDGTAVASGGQGGSGGTGDSGQAGGAGGAGGAAGSLTFNACNAFTGAAGGQVLLNGGLGGAGASGTPGGVGGAGGAGGTILINAKQGITSNATMSALGGAGGSGGSGASAGTNGASGTIALTSGSSVTVGAGTMNAGANTPVVNQNQTTIAALAFCPDSANAAAGIPTLSEWAMLFLSTLMAAFAVWRLRRR